MPNKPVPEQLQFNDQGVAQLSGELSFDTVPALLNAHHDLFQDAGQVTLDLKGVARADSAGVALLIHWLREAQRQGCDLHFDNIPEQMLAIAQVSSVEALLQS